MQGGRKQGRCPVGIDIDQASVGEEERTRTVLEMAKIRNLTYIFRAQRESGNGGVYTPEHLRSGKKPRH